LTYKRGEIYQFMAENRNARDMVRGLWAANAVVSIGFIVFGIFIFAQWRENLGIIQQRSTLIIAALIVLVLLMLNSLKTAVAAWIASADIETGEGGINLYIRSGSPVNISWDATKGAQIRKVDMPVMFPLEKGVKAYTVRVPGLGFLYRLTGLEFGDGLNPVFVVTSAHDHYDRLLDQLRDDPATSV
jgi:hypothetical protein